METLLWILNPIILIPATICVCIMVGFIGEVVIKIIKTMKG